MPNHYNFLAFQLSNFFPSRWFSFAYSVCAQKNAAKVKRFTKSTAPTYILKFHSVWTISSYIRRYAYDEKCFSYALIIEPTPGSSLFVFNLEKRNVQNLCTAILCRKKVMRMQKDWNETTPSRTDEASILHENVMKRIFIIIIKCLLFTLNH